MFFNAVSDLINATTVPSDFNAFAPVLVAVIWITFFKSVGIVGNKPPQATTVPFDFKASEKVPPTATCTILFKPVGTLSNRNKVPQVSMVPSRLSPKER